MRIPEFLEFHDYPWSIVQPPVTPKENGHYCKKRFEYEMCGVAITECLEDTIGRFWATNREYATQVNFCPFCGKEASVSAQEFPIDGNGDRIL